jgi:hypothetical protein
LTLRVNQSLAKTAAGVNYPSARLPRLIQIVAPFSSRLSRDAPVLHLKPWIIAAHALPMALLDAHRCRLYLSGPKERHHYQ